MFRPRAFLQFLGDDHQAALEIPKRQPRLPLRRRDQVHALVAGDVGDLR